MVTEPKLVRFGGVRGLFTVVLFLVPALALPSGCLIKGDGVSSPVDLPSTFKQKAGVEALGPKWWETLEDASLNKLVDAAVGSMGSFTLRGARARFEQAGAAAIVAGAGVFPSLDITGSGAERRGTTQGRLIGANYVLGAAASYEIDLWGRVNSTKNAAGNDALAAREDLDAAGITLSAEVATAWFQLLTQEGQLRLLRNQQESNREVLKLLELRFANGLSDAQELLRQRQLVESSVADGARVEAEIKVLRHQLAVFIGRPPGSTKLPRVTELKELPPLPSAGVPADLIRRRPDLRALWFRVEAADNRVAVRIAERFPTISLSASVNTAAVNVSGLFSNWLLNLAGNLLGPVIDGGRRRGEVVRARAVVAEAVAAYGQAVLTALGEVENALARENARRIEIKSVKRQLDFASRALKAARVSYAQGASDYLRVLDALLTHQELERTLLTLRGELVQTRIQLCRALAGGWIFEDRES